MRKCRDPTAVSWIGDARKAVGIAPAARGDWNGFSWLRR